MKKVSIVIYYYINFFWWPKSGGDFDMMSPPVLKVWVTCPPIPPLCDAPRYRHRHLRGEAYIYNVFGYRYIYFISDLKLKSS